MESEAGTVERCASAQPAQAPGAGLVCTFAEPQSELVWDILPFWPTLISVKHTKPRKPGLLCFSPGTEWGGVVIPSVRAVSTVDSGTDCFSAVWRDPCNCCVKEF